MKVKFNDANGPKNRSKSLQENKQNINPKSDAADRRHKKDTACEPSLKYPNRYKSVLKKDDDIPEIRLPSFLQANKNTQSQIAPYQEEILEYIISTQSDYEFPPSYKKKCLLKKSKRSSYVEFLYKVYLKNKLRRKTLYLSVYYLDRYIQKTNESRSDKLILAVQACMLIAMKYEEIYPPYIKSWIISPAKEVIGQQQKVLKVLDFNLAYTTAEHYLQIYEQKYSHEPHETKELMNLILDLYLFTGFIYNDHPLKIVQQIRSSFRATSIMERDTAYSESDKRIKRMILEYENIWIFLIQCGALLEKRKNR